MDYLFDLKLIKLLKKTLHFHVLHWNWLEMDYLFDLKLSFKKNTLFSCFKLKWVEIDDLIDGYLCVNKGFGGA